jgi:hypothetical protein
MVNMLRVLCIILGGSALAIAAMAINDHYYICAILDFIVGFACIYYFYLLSEI